VTLSYAEPYGAEFQVTYNKEDKTLTIEGKDFVIRIYSTGKVEKREWVILGEGKRNPPEVFLIPYGQNGFISP
jgi:ArsR family metal-binding transcriptional regulator